MSIELDEDHIRTFAYIYEGLDKVDVFRYTRALENPESTMNIAILLAVKLTEGELKKGVELSSEHGVRPHDPEHYTDDT